MKKKHKIIKYQWIYEIVFFSEYLKWLKWKSLNKLKKGN
jgi:hypothetical protein